MTFSAATAAVGIAIAVIASAGASFHAIPVVLLGVGFALASSDWLRLRLRAFGLAMTPVEIPLVLGLFLASPAEVVVGFALGLAPTVARHARQAPRRLTFNLLNGLAYAAIASGLVRWTGGTDLHDPVTWLRVLGSVGLAELVTASSIIVSGLVLTNRAGAIARAMELVLVNASVTLAALVLWSVQPLAPVLLTPPIAALALTYRLRLRESSEKRRLALLGEASRLAPSSDGVRRGELLESIGLATGAELVELATPGLDPAASGWRMGSVWQPGSAAYPRLVASGEEGTRRLATEELQVISGVAGLTARSGLAAELRASGQHLGTLLAVRSDDRNQLPFDDLDERLFALLAAMATNMIASGVLLGTVAELHEEATELRYQASHDGLTKVLVGTSFRAELDRELALGGRPRVLVVIDLDGFKAVNDSYGHAAGDLLLATTATRLRQCVRADDLVGRLGGDEFAILASTDEGVGIDALTDRVLATLRQPIWVEGHQLAVSASLGSTMAQPSLGSAALLAVADAAMYEAKRLGGDRWVAATEPGAEDTHPSLAIT